MRAWLFAAVALGCSARPEPVTDAGVVTRYPAVPNGGGPVLADAELVSVTVTGDAAHDEYTRWLAESGWLTERAGEYGVAGVRYGGTAALAAPPAVLSDEALRASLRQVGVARGKLYVVWLPLGTTLIDRYGLRTCFSNPGTGYHEQLDAEEVSYVVVPACPPRFSAMFDQAASMHFDGARLVVDALTNPSPRNAPAYTLNDTTSGWTALGAEVGDFCWGRFTEHQGVKLQRVWSNAAVRRGEEPCQPAPNGPAFGLTVEPAGRRVMSIGEVVDFEVRGWSNGPRDDWAIDVTPWTGDFGISASLDRGTLNDGQSAKLTVSVPYMVPKGTAGSVLLRGSGGDDSPLWPVALVTR